MTRTLAGLLAALCLATSGCAAFVAGAATGAGVYTYVNGELKRSYQVSLDQASHAAEAALSDLKLPITEESATGLKTTFHADSPEGTPVRVQVELKSTKIVEIAVRSGIVGYWNREYSEKVHAKIADRLFSRGS